MDFYRINTIPLVEEDCCVLVDAPVGTSPRDYKMSVGERMGDDYPADARMFMSDRYPGIKLSSVLANTRNMLISSRDIKEIICGVSQVEIECLPVAICSHKRRLVSLDYFIINPIGTIDCLNLQKSRIEWLDGEVVEVEECVLDASKVTSAPDIFRVQEDPRAYVISARLGKALAELRPTNFYIHKLLQA